MISAPSFLAAKAKMEMEMKQVTILVFSKREVQKKKEGMEGGRGRKGSEINPETHLSPRLYIR